MGDHVLFRWKTRTSNSEWLKAGAKAKVLNDNSLSDEHLERVSECKTAAIMWKVIFDFLQRRTLLNRLASGQKFNTAKMRNNESTATYFQGLSACSGSQVYRNAGREPNFAMPNLCGSPSKFKHLIVEIDAMIDDEQLTLDFIKTHLLQEEQRMSDRSLMLHSKALPWSKFPVALSG